MGEQTTDDFFEGSDNYQDDLDYVLYGEQDNFDGYKTTTVDPGDSLFYTTVGLVCALMVVILPCLVCRSKMRRRKQKLRDEALRSIAYDPDDVYFMVNDKSLNLPDRNIPSDPIEPEKKGVKRHRATCWTIIRPDRETRHILRYAIPFTVYAFAEAVMENSLMALVGQYLGIKEMTAYVLVMMLVELTDKVLLGNMQACTTQCAHAIGASNNFLAGQYVQLSIFFYLLGGIPIAILWSFYIGDFIKILGWGGEAVAKHAEEFAQIYVWSHVLGAVHMAFGQLLDVTNKEIFTTLVGLAELATNLVVLVIAFTQRYGFTLVDVAYVYVASSTVYLWFTVVVACSTGWLKPFNGGIFFSVAICNCQAVGNLLKTSIPLSFGSLLSHAEWPMLAVFAAQMGEAEVATWAILGVMWQVTDSIVSGIGDAAEIRVAYHLGNNHPALAKLTAYKSMLIGMLGSVILSGTFYTYVDEIPALITSDATIQAMLADVLPYLGIGNLALAFGYICWYILGAQSKYKIGTWITLAGSWGITLPLGFVFVYHLNWDLQGLSAAVVLGYVAMGVALSYTVLNSDWKRRAQKIYGRNHAMDDDNEEEEQVERHYAALNAKRSRAALATARNNTLLLQAPPGLLNIRIGDIRHKPGAVVVEVFESSPFWGQIWPGDIILAVDGVCVQHQPAHVVYDIMSQNRGRDRSLTIMTTPSRCRDEDTSQILLYGNVPDIVDFDEESYLMERELTETETEMSRYSPVAL